MTNPASAADARFCRLLRHLRRRRGLSLRQFAERVHFSHTYLWEIESGRKPATTHVAAVLDVALVGDLREWCRTETGPAHRGRKDATQGGFRCVIPAPEMLALLAI